LYIDTVTPTASVQYTTGSTVATIELTPSYYATYGTTFYFLSFAVQSLSDVDVALVEVVGGSLNATYSDVNDVPMLSHDTTGGGVYTITLFDRTGNAFSFNVTIAGNTPTLQMGSLTNKVRLSFAVSLGDRNNALLSLRLYKILKDGSYVELPTDSNGLAVSELNLSYVLTEGGKYTLRYTDIFGRNTEFEPFFYEKDLPVGSFSGVKDGGVTNSAVTFSTSTDNGYIIYSVVGNVRSVLNSSLYNVSSFAGTVVLTFPNNTENNLRYSIYLWNLNNDTLFNEYSFSIDTIMSAFVIRETGTDNVLGQGAVTNKGFTITSSEIVTARYKLYGTTIISTYTMGTVFNKTGIYVFTLLDGIGNSSEFTMTLDNTVAYSTSGRHTKIDTYTFNAYNALTLTITEQYTLVSATLNGVSFSYVNGSTLSTDGKYLIKVTDTANNTATFDVTIDTAPPSYELTNVTDGGVTNKNVTLAFSGEVTAKVNNIDVLSGQIYSDEGRYSAVITAVNGSVVRLAWTIDKTVNFSVRGTHTKTDEYTFAAYNALTVHINEAYTLVAATHGEEDFAFESGDSLSADGVYILTIRDTVGNSVTLNVYINTAPPTYRLTNVDNKGITNKDVTLTFERGATCEVNHENVTSGSVFSAEGKYTAVITAENGTTITLTWTIDHTLLYSTRGKYTETEKYTFTAYNSLTLSITEQHTINGATLNGSSFSFVSGTTLSADGVYVITVSDSAGNTVTFNITVDTSAPTYELVNVTDGGSTNKDVTLEFSDTATCTVNDIDTKSGTVFVAEGKYTAIITAKSGLYIRVVWTIDKSVSYRLSVMPGEVTSDSVTLETTETITESQYKCNGADIEADEVFKTGGYYEIKFTDELGNSGTVTFSIIPARTSRIDVEVSDLWQLQSVHRDGALLNYTLPDTRLLQFDTNGTYDIVFTNSFADTTVSIFVDSTPPTATVASSYGRLVIEDISKDDVTVSLLLDGAELEYKSTANYTEAGTYTVTLTDTLGNVATYIYQLKKEFNEWAYVVIAAGGVLATALVIVFIRSKRIKA
jgi:hypothetical protein